MPVTEQAVDTIIEELQTISGALERMKRHQARPRHYSLDSTGFMTLPLDDLRIELRNFWGRLRPGEKVE